jgi:two-component system chemotaxis response regulator CheY
MQHCFVVDDSEVIRKYARLIFESMGFRVSAAEAPGPALERMKDDPPDYVLVDWRIPGADMHAFITHVRTLPLETPPVIIYTPTEGNPLDLKRALDAGADAVLLKPFNREIVEMKLREMRAAA